MVDSFIFHIDWIIVSVVASRRPGLSRSKRRASLFRPQRTEARVLAYVYFEAAPGRRSTAKLVGFISSYSGYRSSAL